MGGKSMAFLFIRLNKFESVEIIREKGETTICMK